MAFLPLSLASFEIQYNEKVSEADMLQAWNNIMTAYGKKWNVFALDIKNEPNGVATWVSY